jgi:tetratricopeptide (TPR) repeat protein
MLGLEGGLEEHPMPRLLNFLHESSQTGRLMLNHSGVSKTLYVVEGLVANVESSLRDETLGRYLIKQGKITEEDYQESIDLMMKEGIKQGASFVKLGVLKPRELFQAVKDQTKEKLVTCFGWTKGEYRYKEELSFVEDINRFETPFIPVMREGLSRFFPPEALSRELELVGTGPLVPEPDLLNKISAWNLDKEEAAWLIKVEGTRSMKEVLEKAGEKERRLLYLLLLVGLIKPSERLAEKVREVIPGEVQEPLAAEQVFEPATIHLADEMEVEMEGMEDKRTEDEILEEYIDLKSKDYFSLLGVGADTGDEEIERAYREKINQFARENFVAGVSAEAEARLEEINTRIIMAYESLKNPERREKYLQEIGEKPAPEASPGLEAEKCLQKGMEYVRTRKWAGAQEMFEKAVELKPEEPEFYGYLGWAIYCNEDLEFNQRRDMAIEKMGMALEMNPNMDSIHVFLGKIFKDEGNINEAVSEFRQALQCNPNCREAARELKAHGVEVET